jgi:hypothetical protein
MKKSVAVIGAGGKMGARAAAKIGFSKTWDVLLVETREEKARALRDQGLTVTPAAEAMRAADFAMMAVPDALIGRIARELVPEMKPGATLIMLDAAAAYVGELPVREGVTQMIVHPCHPPFFTDHPSPEERADYFGGVAPQNMIVSMISGDEAAFAEGIEICRAVFAPVLKAIRVTPEQFAQLEPAMSEILMGAAAVWMKEAMEEAVRKGVPREAAEAFTAGHAQIALAIAFGAEKAPFSDAAKLAVKWGTEQFINPAWRRVFDRDVLEPAVRAILK